MGKSERIDAINKALSDAAAQNPTRANAIDKALDEFRKTEPTQYEKNWASVGQNIVQGLGDASASLAKTGKALTQFRSDTDPIQRMMDEIGKGTYSLLPQAAQDYLGKLGVNAERPGDWLYDITIASNKYGEQLTQKANAEADESVRLINNWLVRPVANALPNTVFALMTGGSSTAAQLGTQSTGLVGQLSNSLLTNPQFYASAAQIYGPTYYDALESGATEQQAMWTALLNSALGSAIEVGATPNSGGLETFLKSGDKSFLEFVKSLPEEGTEEVLQGMLERFLQKTVAGDEETKWFSTDPNEKAVFNPSTSAQEFAGGALVGGVLGGTTYTVNTVINNVNKVKTGSGLDYATLAQNTAAKVGIEETVAAEVAEIAKSTNTPVVWVDAIGSTPDGGVINGVFKDNVMVLAANGTGDKRTVAAHELTHSIEGTAAYQNIVNEIAVDRKNNNAASLDVEAASIQALYREQLGMDITIEQAKAEAVARYVEQRLDTSPAVLTALRSYNGGVFARMLQNRRYNQQYKAADEATRQQLRLQRNVAEGIRQRPRTNITPEQIRAVLDRVENGEMDGAKMSIQYTTDNAPVVVIEDNILDGVPQSKWIDKVKETISDKFSMGIPVSGRLIKVNQKTRNEYTKSKYSQRIESQSPVVYEDKFKAAGNLDEIVLASTNYVNEDLKHKRKDNFKEFARGDVLLRIGNNDYSAKVIVGFTDKGAMVLYDVIDFTPDTFALKTKGAGSSATQMQSLARANSTAPSINTNIAQSAPGVNTQYTQNNNKHSISSVTDELLKPYIEKYGGMKLPGREIETPVKVDDSGEKVSQAASTYLNATDDQRQVQETAESILKGAYNYTPSTIKGEEEKAAKFIEDRGYEYMATKVADDAEDDGFGGGNEFSFNSFVRYKVLLKQALANGDYDTAQNCQVAMFKMVSDSAKIMRFQLDVLLKGVDGKRQAQLVRKKVEKMNKDTVEKVTKERGQVPQETIDRLREQKGEAEKEYHEAAGKVVERQAEIQKISRHLEELQKGIDQTLIDTQKTDKATAKLAKEIAVKCKKAADAVADFNVSEEKYQQALNDAKEARQRLRRLLSDTKKYNRRSYKYLWDLLLVIERIETAVQEQKAAKEAYDIAKDKSKFANKVKRQLVKYGAGVQVAQVFLDELENAKNQEEIDIAKAHIYQNLADQLPPTAYEQFMSWRYLAMLFNPKTWIKNEVGNLSNLGLHKLDDLVAYAYQRMFLKEGNKIVAYRWKHTELGKMLESKITAAADTATAREGSHKYDDVQGQVEERRRTFNNDALEKVSGVLDTALNEGGLVALSGGKWKIGAGDKPMFRQNYIDALGNYMVSNGLTEVTAEADAWATKVAQDYVFHTQNAAAQALTKLRNSGKLGRVAVDSLMPFIRTPANVLAQGLQRSPIGFAVAGTKLVKAAIAQKQGKGSVSPELINSMARASTGTALFILGVIASAIGLATGKEEGEDAKSRTAGELAGAQDLSINILGTKFSFDWLEPASYPFLVGVLMNDGFESENPWGSLLDAASAGYSQVFDMSMLSGLLDAFTSNYDDGSQMVAQAVGSVFENAVTQSIPTLVGQLARTIDPVKRKTTSGESWVTDTFGDNFASDTISTVLARIPGASTILEAERDVFGNEVGRVGDKDNVVLNAVQQFLSPAAITRKGGTDQKTDDVTAVLLELYESTEQGKVIPSEIKAKDFKEKLSDEGLADAYTSQLYQEARVDVGQAQLEAIWEMIEQNQSVELTKTYETAAGKEKRRTYSKRFDDMTEEEQVKAVYKVANAAKEDYLDELIKELEKGRKTK